MTELPQPTQDERTMGMLVHVLSIFTGFWAALIILIIKRDSKFVAFHSLQCVFWHLLYMILMFGCFIFFFMAVFIGMVSQLAVRSHGSAPPAFLFMFPMVWVIFIGFWVLNLVLGIVFAIKANAGEWANYPLVGNLARRVLGI